MVDNHLPQLKLALTEIEAKLDSYERRLGAMDSRAGVLIAAAGIATTLRGIANPSGWISLAVAGALAAAVLGVIALFPGRAIGLNALTMRKQVLSRSTEDGMLWLIDQKTHILATNEPRIVAKSRLIAAGFILFAVSIAFTLLFTTGIQLIWR